ncbi:MAG: ribonuclease HII [Anaerolineae bacterium]
MPDLSEETRLWQLGYGTVAGLDEVGRGALAGPVVAAAVVLPILSDVPPALAEVNDSKQLSTRQRQRLAVAIHRVARGVGVGYVAAAEIDRIGIVAATRQAMQLALAQLHALGMPADFLLIDFLTLELPVPQKGIVRGDSCSLSIAAASIVAKVTRDRWLTALHDTFPAYDFAHNKGYGTPAHLRALATVGPCPEHRLSFRRVLPTPQPLATWAAEQQA